MVRELRVRLGSAKLLLGSLQGDAHKNASRAQAAAFLEALNGASLTVAERADLMVMVGDVAWGGDDKNTIIGALAVPSPSASKPVRAPRSQMQNFLTISEFFTDAEWSVICSETAGFLQKREVILSRATKLSCRCPCEKSSKRFTSILLICTGKADLPSGCKWDTKESLKTELKSMIRRMSKPVAYLEALPSSPEELMLKHPDLYAAAYRGTDVPVPCKMDLQQVVNLDAMYKTRGGGGMASSSNLPASPPALQLLAPSGGGNVGQMAQTLMQGMFSMAQSQERMVNMMMMGSNMPQGRSMRSLSALADLSSLRGDGQEQLRLSHASFRPGLAGAITDVRPEAAVPQGAILDFPPQDANPDGLADPSAAARVQADIAVAARAKADASAARKQAAAALAAQQRAAVAPAVSIKIEEINDDDDDPMTLLDALEKRDEDKRKAKAEAKAEERAAKKAKSAAQKAEEKAEKAEAKKAEAKAARDLSLPVKGAPPIKQKPSNDDDSSKQVLKRPSGFDGVASSSAGAGSWFYNHERTRSQFLARAGFKGPGSSKSFKYGDGCQHEDEASAKAAVELFVAEKNRDLSS